MPSLRDSAQQRACGNSQEAPCCGRLPRMSERGQYGQSLRDYHRGRSLIGAEPAVSEPTPSTKQSSMGSAFLRALPLALFLGGSAIMAAIATNAVESVAGASKDAADALWARQKDRSFHAWLRTPAEDRRLWPEERRAWNAWNRAARKIDDE